MKCNQPVVDNTNSKKRRYNYTITIVIYYNAIGCLETSFKIKSHLIFFVSTKNLFIALILLIHTFFFWSAQRSNNTLTPRMWRSQVWNRPLPCIASCIRCSPQFESVHNVEKTAHLKTSKNCINADFRKKIKLQIKINSKQNRRNITSLIWNEFVRNMFKN